MVASMLGGSMLAGPVPSVRELVEEQYPALLRVASFRGAKRRDVDRAIVEAARAAASAGAGESEALLFRALIGRVAALEQRTPPRPESWKAKHEPALEAKNVEPEGSRWE